MDWFPGVSQAKSVFQLVTGDVKGAVETQKNFVHSCPGVAQVTSVVHLATGNEQAFYETNKQSVQVVSSMANGIPGVGHVKAVVHELAGDSTGAESAWNSATRTTFVMAAGAGGFVVGGPVGAAVAGLGTGATHDKLHSVVTGEKQGHEKQWDKLKNEPNAGNAFDTIMGYVGDGITGYSAGQMVNRVQTANQIAANKAKLEVMNDKMNNMFDAKGGGGGGGGMGGGGAKGGGGGGGAYKLGKDMQALYTETVALERSIGIGETVYDPKTGLTDIPKGKSGVVLNSQPSQRAPTYENSKSTITVTQTASTRTQTTQLNNWTAEPTSQHVKPVAKDSLTQLIESFEELLVYKNSIQQFQQKVFVKFGTRLEKRLAKVVVKILEYVVDLSTTLKLKKKGVSLQRTPKKLIEDSVEDEREDGEIVDRTLDCIQWNMCGFVAQILPFSQKKAEKIRANLEIEEEIVVIVNLAKNLLEEPLGEKFGAEEVKDSAQFLYELAVKRPHILLLNEIKVTEVEEEEEGKKSVVLYANSLGYKVAYSRSELSGKKKLVPVRGTAILYRPNIKYLIFQSSLDKRPVLDLQGRPELEVVKANFLFHSKQKVYKNGKTEELITHNLTFVGAYLLKYSDKNFKETIKTFNEFEDGVTIFAGDLNMDKEEHLDKWRNYGFVDMLELGWKTNKQTRGESEPTESKIDYVMVKAGNEPFVTVFEPIKFHGRSLHYPIYFQVHDASAICMEELGKRFRAV